MKHLYVVRKNWTDIKDGLLKKTNTFKESKLLIHNDYHFFCAHFTILLSHFDFVYIYMSFSLFLKQ